VLQQQVVDEAPHSKKADEEAILGGYQRRQPFRSSVRLQQQQEGQKEDTVINVGMAWRCEVRGNKEEDTWAARAGQVGGRNGREYNRQRGPYRKRGFSHVNGN
jgi:hypothetical protein